MNIQSNVSIHNGIHQEGHSNGKRAEAQSHALRLARQAQTWAAYVQERSRLQASTIHRKALDALVFSLEMRARSLAIPSKLSGTSHYQQALAILDELQPPCGHRLEVYPEGKHLIISFADMLLGQVQDKHVPWLRPLLHHGVTVHLLGVTGTERAEGFYGCNVAFGRVSAALERLRALGEDASGDGSVQAVELPEDIYLWRDRKGRAHASVPHIVRHSPTGIEFGYGGSGPADLALSILRRFTDPETADRLYQRFKDDVIATMPEEGGLLRAAFVVSWLYAHGA